MAAFQLLHHCELSAVNCFNQKSREIFQENIQIHFRNLIAFSLLECPRHPTLSNDQVDSKTLTSMSLHWICHMVKHNHS